GPLDGNAGLLGVVPEKVIAAGDQPGFQGAGGGVVPGVQQRGVGLAGAVTDGSVPARSRAIAAPTMPAPMTTTSLMSGVGVVMSVSPWGRVRPSRRVSTAAGALQRGPRTTGVRRCAGVSRHRRPR